MILYFLLIVVALAFQPCISLPPNCLRFCRVSFRNFVPEKSISKFKLQLCLHLIISFKNDKGVINFEKLDNARKQLQELNIAKNVKLLASLPTDLRLLTEIDKIFTNKEEQILKNFDGFYLSWKHEDFGYSSEFRVLLQNQRQEILNSNIKNLRRNFNNHSIVVTVGAEYTHDGYFDYKFINENVNYIALESNQLLMDLHSQNDFSARQRILTSIYQNDTISLDYTAKKWITNGVTKEKLIVYVTSPFVSEEWRLKAIWSSLNGFGGIFIDDVQKFYQYGNELNEMVDSIKKFEQIQTCNSEVVTKKLNLTCYVSIYKNFISKDRKEFDRCHRIIIQTAFINKNLSIDIPIENFKILLDYFRSSKSDTNVFISINVLPEVKKNIDNNDMKQIASEIIAFLKTYNLNGIELICDHNFNAKHCRNLVTTLILKMPNIEIGFQVDVFEVSESLASIMFYASWVTHQINSISDAFLKIFYQWNKINQLYDLQKMT